MTQPNTAEQRLAYEIMVTAPRTRSQGWHGVLYNKGGSAIEIPAGQAVETSVGRFISVARQALWIPCGMIHEDSVASPINVELKNDSNDWGYKLYVAAEGSKSENWEGNLFHDGKAVPHDSGKVETPMGPFVWLERQHLWGPGGWFPAAWSQVKRQLAA